MKKNNLYGLIGKNIGYSLSPFIFQNIFQVEKCDCRYELFDETDPGKWLKNLKNLPYLKGFNVTIPYKQFFAEKIKDTDHAVQLTGTVNTIVITSPFHLKGFNTDLPGFEKAIREFTGNDKMQALVLGNGATASTVKHALNKLQIPAQTVSRKKTKSILTYDELNEKIIASHRLIINTTPLGSAQFPGQKPNIPYEAISRNHYLFDVIYSPPLTPFLIEGLKRSARVENGLKMLVYQAWEAWKIWKKYIK